MSYGYSKDYRERVISYIEEGNGRESAMILFKVSRKTIYNWLSRKKETGSVLGIKRIKRRSKVFDYDKLSQYVKDNEDAYLDEIAKNVGGSASGVCRALKRMKITRKKSRRYTKKEMKKSEQSSS